MEALQTGTIIKTVGLKGELKLKSTTFFAEERYQKGNKVYLSKDGKNFQKCTVLSYRFYQGFDFVILKEISSSNIQIMYVDLSSFTIIDYFVNEIIKKNIHIDFVYHNAGIYNIKNKKSESGYELMMATNYLGTYYLNEKLVNYFKTKHHLVHIIFTTSVAAYRTKVDYETFYLCNSTKPIKYYANSKLMLIHYYKHLIEQNNFNIIFHLVHPGITYTPLFSKGYSKWFTKIINIFMSVCFHKVEKAALCTLKAMTESTHSYYCPKGLLNVSGYPKRKKII
jgi:NAD(P)-dependent dehydrogenase (short-subunit alcohol dehydrogenase family)